MIYLKAHLVMTVRPLRLDTFDIHTYSPNSYENSIKHIYII